MPEAEFEAVLQSVLEAVRRLCEDDAAARAWRRFRRNAPGYTESHLRADLLLSKFRYAPRRPLGEPDVATEIAQAAERNDTRFFIRFGKVLSRQPIPAPKRLGDFRLKIQARLTQFMIGHWADHQDEICPALCLLTPDGLADVCNHYLHGDFSVDGIVKLRQRLGLKSSRRHKIHVLRVGGRLRWR